jgi:hypothetical protein
LSEKDEIKETNTIAETAGEDAAPCAPPEPVATGNESLEIITHSLYIKEGSGAKGSGVVLTIKNIADGDIGKAVFNIVFYGAAGDVIDTVEDYTGDIDKGGMRNFCVECQKTEADIRSYAVNTVQTTITPEPVIMDNDEVKIITHTLAEGNALNEEGFSRSIDVSIRNVFDKTFASVILEAVFMDGEGNELDTVRQKVLEIKPDSSRTVQISPAKPDAGMFRTYRLSVYRTVTTDIEKVQIKSHEMKPLDGAVEISGVLKNVSDGKADAAVVTLFKDVKDEKIATKVAYIRDIDPGASKQFRFKFVEPEDESVNSYVISVGSIAEEAATPAV